MVHVTHRHMVKKHLTTLPAPSKIAWLILEEWDVISFDHDLQDFSNGREYTGYDCLKILLDNYGKYDDCPMIEFHTMNPIGRERMRGYLASWAMCHM